MIAQLRGNIIEKQGNKLVLDVNGVGYVVELTTSSMISQPRAGAETTVKTYLHVRDDSWQLFGFASQEEKTLFEKLISISGIGPKLGMSILSSYSIDDFKRAVASEDIDFLSTIPRLGAKNAKRIILELKDKIANGTNDFLAPQFAEAKQALKSLGYTDVEISKALSSADAETDTEKLVKTALRNLANG